MPVGTEMIGWNNHAVSLLPPGFQQGGNMGASEWQTKSCQGSRLHWIRLAKSGAHSAKSGCGFVPISSSHSLRSYSLPRIFTYLTIELYLELGFSLFLSSLSCCQCCNSVGIFVFRPNASCHTDHTLREISTWQKNQPRETPVTCGGLGLLYHLDSMDEFPARPSEWNISSDHA